MPWILAHDHLSINVLIWEETIKNSSQFLCNGNQMAYLFNLSIPRVHLNSSKTMILKVATGESSSILLERCLIMVCF